MERWFQISNLTQENRKGKGKKPSNPQLVKEKQQKLKMKEIFLKNDQKIEK